jgi:phosphonate transport system substrate-binding protein
MEKKFCKTVSSVLLATGMVVLLAIAAWADDCTNRGDLDVQFCDENGDLVADTPKDSSEWLETPQP